eukprot:2075562-Rhodomonas_salina.1
MLLQPLLVLLLLLSTNPPADTTILASKDMQSQARAQFVARFRPCHLEETGAAVSRACSERVQGHWHGPESRE